MNGVLRGRPLCALVISASAPRDGAGAETASGPGWRRQGRGVEVSGLLPSHSAPRHTCDGTLYDILCLPATVLGISRDFSGRKTSWLSYVWSLLKGYRFLFAVGNRVALHEDVRILLVTRTDPRKPLLY